MDPRQLQTSTNWWGFPVHTQTTSGGGRTFLGLGFLGFAMAIYWISRTRRPSTEDVKEAGAEVKEKAAQVRDKLETKKNEVVNDALDATQEKIDDIRKEVGGTDV